MGQKQSQLAGNHIDSQLENVSTKPVLGNAIPNGAMREETLFAKPSAPVTAGRPFRISDDQPISQIPAVSSSPVVPVQTSERSDEMRERVSISNISPMSSPLSTISDTSQQSSASPPTPVPIPSLPTSSGAGRVVPSSDDEDSDSTLEDLFPTKFAAKAPTIPPPTTSIPIRQTSPIRPARRRKVAQPLFPPSPPERKYNNDMGSLVKQDASDKAAQESANRIKALQTRSQEPRESTSNVVFSSELIERMVEDKDGDRQAVRKNLDAIQRTQANLSDKRWCFFDTELNGSLVERRPFPKASVPKDWEDDLKTQQIRRQTFASGFASCMVSYGKKLPDELILWLLDEIPHEDSDDLRYSYSNTLMASKEQLPTLIEPTTIENMFRSLGATSAATSTTEKIVPILKAHNPYPNRDWSKLLSLIRFLKHAAKQLLQASRNRALYMLLRLSVDHILLDRTDLLFSVQKAITKLCEFTSEDYWETCCQEMCGPLFTCVEQPSLRLQIVKCIPCTTPQTHDLRRRLAMAFYFNDVSKSTTHSYHITNLTQFSERLQDPPFLINQQTDYQELTALICLLDIAIDDGRSPDIYLENKAEEVKFNQDVDALAARVTVMHITTDLRDMWTQRAQDAQSGLAFRLQSTVRTKPKPKQDILHGLVPEEEDHESMKAAMARFVVRHKKEDV